MRYLVLFRSEVRQDFEMKGVFRGLLFRLSAANKSMRAAVTFSVLSCFWGCASPLHRTVERIEVGQAKRMVLHHTGGPQASSRSRGKDIWEYRYLGESGEPLVKRVVFNNGKVESIQDGRQWQRDVIARAEAEDEINFNRDRREFYRASGGAFNPNLGNPEGTAEPATNVP